MTRTSTRRFLCGKGAKASAAYVGVVALAALVHGIAGAPDDWSAYLALATWPGSALVTVAAFCLAAATGAVDTADTAPGPPFLLLPLTLGALVNVLLVRGACAFARHFVREARHSRRA
jgi:hypothetical protein